MAVALNERGDSKVRRLCFRDQKLDFVETEPSRLCAPIK